MSELGTITFVPSVHYSPVHLRRVQTTIRETEPDVIAVELDKDRFERLRQDGALDASSLARNLPAPTAATYQAVKAIQQAVARLYGFDRGHSDVTFSAVNGGACRWTPVLTTTQW